MSSSSGARYRDLKDRIKVLETENGELKERLAISICPYCHKVRGEAHGYVNGVEVACPQFAYFPEQVKGFKKEAVTNAG